MAGSRAPCFTSIGWTNAHYHDGTREAETAGHRRRDWNGRWICLRYALEHPAVELVTTIGRRKIGVFALEAKRGTPSRLRGLLRARRRALSPRCCGLLSGYVYRVGVGRGTSHDNRGLYDRVRTSSPHEQPDCGFSFLSGVERIRRTKSDGFSHAIRERLRTPYLHPVFPAFISSDRVYLILCCHARNRI